MDPNVERFLHALQSRGIDAALGLLNQETDCRYTAVFELVGEQLVNQYFFDRRHQPRPSYVESVCLRDSYCQIALREGEFRSQDTSHDSRVDYSPYKGVVVSYHAVPLLARGTSLRGTLCHFDLVPSSLDDYQFAMLRQAARILPAFLYGACVETRSADLCDAVD